MTNFEKIELFLKKITAENGDDSIRIQQALDNLIEAMYEMSHRTTDDKMPRIFTNILISVALKTDKESLKNLCLKILNQFNRENNTLSN